jgi:hypothetical protein
MRRVPRSSRGPEGDADNASIERLVLPQKRPNCGMMQHPQPQRLQPDGCGARDCLQTRPPET